MTKMNLQARIDRLKLAPAMRDMPAFFDRIYNYIWQMETATDPLLPNEIEDCRRAEFETEHGTREEFIETRMKNWNRRFPRKGEENV